MTTYEDDSDGLFSYASSNGLFLEEEEPERIEQQQQIADDNDDKLEEEILILSTVDGSLSGFVKSYGCFDLETYWTTTAAAATTREASVPETQRGNCFGISCIVLIGTLGENKHHGAILWHTRLEDGSRSFLGWKNRVFDSNGVRGTSW